MLFKGSNRTTSMLAVIAFIFLACNSQAINAQTKRYQPSSSTISPYLNLTRFNNASVPNYYSLVRPLQHQQSLNKQEQALRKQQATTLGKIQNDLLRATTASGTGTGSGFMTQGLRSRFLDTTRYYRQPNVPRARR